MLNAFKPDSIDVQPRAVDRAGELRVARFGTWAEAERLEPSWNNLLSESASRTVFLTWEWLTSWWNAYGASRELMVLACVNGEGSLVGVAPLYCDYVRIPAALSLRILRLVGDGTHDSDNLDLIVREGWEAAAIRAWLDWLERHRSEWDILELNTLPAESPVTLLLVDELRRRRWTVLQHDGPHACVSLPRDWSLYLRSLSRKMRDSIQYYTRSLERRHHVRLLRCTSQAELPFALECLVRLHSRRWEARGERGALNRPERRAFFQEVVGRLLARGWLDLWALEADGSVVAMELGFRYRDTEYFLQAGFDPAWHSKSVGLVLKARILRELIAAGIRHYDFLGGNQAHKLRWGAELRRYLFLRCAPARSRGAVFLDIMGLAASAKEWLRNHVSASSWGVFRRVFRHIRPFRE